MDLQGRRVRETHEVENQPPPLLDYNAFSGDRCLREAVLREGGKNAVAGLEKVGEAAGSAEAITWGFQANEHVPKLRTHDRFGHRIDEVEFHPSWHRLMEKATAFGLHASAWHDEREGAHVARAGAFFVWNQVEAGHGCPISMTYAAVPALRTSPKLAARFEPLFAARAYDPVLRPAAEKASALCGMAMTEKQGGSDVRANTTFAEYAGEDASGSLYEITGHKWFCSAPMCDTFLVLAQTTNGLSCFLLPRILDDGSRNAFRIQRLKDKLGNRSNASSEVEFEAATAWLLGEEGRGIQTILEMVNSTRLDCVNGSAALMRQALTQAIHHTRHRSAFGELLIDQPAMRNVLADLTLESEASTVLLMRLARAADRASSDPQEAAIKRLGTAIAKYWVCKRAPMVVAEALECLGGNGYVEESMMPRLYREAPLNSIWEGSGNINALDALRAMAKTPETLDSLLGEFAPVRNERGIADVLDDALKDVKDPRNAQTSARYSVERLALLWQYALLRQWSPAAIADAFLHSRIQKRGGAALGTLPAAADTSAVIERAAN